MKSIVVGVDESDGASLALRWAAEEAELHGGTLTAVLCWGYLDQHHMHSQQPFDPTYGEGAATRTVREIVEAGLGERAADVRCRAVNDLPARGLLTEGAAADLLVVGARGLGGLKGALVGSVSQHVLQHATVPVAVVRPSAPVAPPRVVVGVDGSDTSRRALAWAIDEGRARGARVHAVHAWTLPYVASPYVPVVDPGGADLEAAAHRMLDDLLDAADPSGLVEPVERTVVYGGAGPAIVEAAEGATLVVVGSRGLGGFRGLLLGSVGRQVTHHAPCPVIVVRPSS